jgi:hypothetical protein
MILEEMGEDGCSSLEVDGSGLSESSSASAFCLIRSLGLFVIFIETSSNKKLQIL